MKRISFKFKQYKFELFNRPGEWMGEDALVPFQARLINVARTRLGCVPDFSFFREKKYLSNKLVILCTDIKSGLDICFCAMCYIGVYKKRNVIHLGAVYSTKENKGLMELVYIFGLTYVILRNWIFKKIYITSLTHTPKIFGVVAEKFEKVFPDLNASGKPGELHLELRELFTRTYLTEWDLPAMPVINGDFIIRGFRKQRDGSLLYPDTIETVPKHRNPEYTTRCSNLLDYKNGDIIFQAGIIYGLWSVFKHSSIFSKG